MENWTVCGESMPNTVCEVRVTDKDFSRTQGKQHRQRENPYSGLAKGYSWKNILSTKSWK